MGTTLKIYSYKGVNIYIRWLGGLWYEFLISFKGGIYAHQLQLLKPIHKERRNTLQERHDGAMKELMMGANTLVDTLTLERSLKNQIKQLYAKSTKIIRNYISRSSILTFFKERRQGSTSSPSIVHEQVN